MHTELIVPLEENENYADALTADHAGIDLHIDGETYSASLDDVDRTELALAVLVEADELEGVDDAFLDLAEATTERLYSGLIADYPDGEEGFYLDQAAIFLAVASRMRKRKEESK